jgi:hypothetical protein
MAYVPTPPVAQMTATQMKAIARVQSEAMMEVLKSTKLHTAMADVRARRSGATGSQRAAR